MTLPFVEGKGGVTIDKLTVMANFTGGMFTLQTGLTVNTSSDIATGTFQGIGSLDLGKAGKINRGHDVQGYIDRSNASLTVSAGQGRQPPPLASIRRRKCLEQ